MKSCTFKLRNAIVALENDFYSPNVYMQPLTAAEWNHISFSDSVYKTILLANTRLSIDVPIPLSNIIGMYGIFNKITWQPPCSSSSSFSNNIQDILEIAGLHENVMKQVEMVIFGETLKFFSNKCIKGICMSSFRGWAFLLGLYL